MKSKYFKLEIGSNLTLIIIIALIVIGAYYILKLTG